MVATTTITTGLTTTLSSRGQVVIPKAVRDRLGLSTGDVLEIEQQGTALVLRVVEENPAAIRERLFGPPVPVDSIVGMFANHVPPAMHGRSMSEMRKVAQAALAKSKRANKR
jgi:AbrB family looped-hinge helix DNA binding protein